ncbi:hypothetical protein D3C72_1902670 [compost metagenome]
MGPGDSLDHGQAEAGAGGLGGKEGFTQTRQHSAVDTAAAIADAQSQVVSTGVEMHLQAHLTGTGLDGILDQIEDRADQGVAIAQQFADMTVALPANRQVLHVRQRRRLQ